MDDKKPEIPLTPEAEAAGHDPYKVSDPPFETVKEGITDDHS
jgi:hypothetical protein